MACSPSVVTRSCSVRCRHSTPLPKRRSLGLLQPQLAAVTCDIDLDISVTSLPQAAPANCAMELPLAQLPAATSCDLISSQPHSRCAFNFSLTQPPMTSSGYLDLTSILSSVAPSMHLDITPTPRRPRHGLSRFRTSTPTKLVEACFIFSSDLSSIANLPSTRQPRRPVPRTTLRSVCSRNTDLALPVQSAEDRVNIWLQTSSDQHDVTSHEASEPRRMSRFCRGLRSWAQSSTEMLSSAVAMETMAKRKNEENEKKRDEKEKKKWRSHVKRIKKNLRNLRKIRVEFRGA
ncbi:hypothetical protein CAPTEDRAFT_193158 [Capitella teleta]|uniref:Uncharacterized protein n=1 Tax=Capitella teleta TaxID=283909 RepID=R7UNU7_CAPTE|nr:hypothetical protein CAPTEDRAFT_193158 [Capitella teleta]|eukprot:ELU07788.1 hypothetical protein CAPTEDRAFT_193158 [Capitella teleta]